MKFASYLLVKRGSNPTPSTRSNPRGIRFSSLVGSTTRDAEPNLNASIASRLDDEGNHVLGGASSSLTPLRSGDIDPGS